MNMVKSYAKYCPECFNQVRENLNDDLSSVGAQLSKDEYKKVLMARVEDEIEELEHRGCYRECPKCEETFIIEEATAIDKLRADFNDGILCGTQLDVLDNNRLVSEEFALNEEQLPSDFEERLLEMEVKFDEWWMKNENSPQVKWSIGQQCRNFLAAIRKRYVNVNMVRKMTSQMNSRERTLVWGTWKGWNRRVRFAK